MACQGIVIIVRNSRHSKLSSHRLPFFLKIGPIVMRKADSARIEIDVKHLAGPGDRHGIPAVARRIQDDNILPRLTSIGREHRCNPRLGGASDTTFRRILDHGDVTVIGDEILEDGTAVGSCRPFLKAGARRWTSRVDLMRGKEQEREEQHREHHNPVTRFGMMALLMFFATVTYADDDLIDADRPGIADGSHSVKKGHFQIELGYNRNDNNDGPDVNWPLLLRYGITDKFEFRVESGTFEHTNNENGFDSVSVGFKDHFYDRNNVSLGVIGRWFFPSGSGDFATHKSQLDLRLAGDIQFGERWAINPNVGIASSTATAAMTVQYNLTQKSNVFVDGSVQNSQVLLDSGFAWIVRSNTQIDASIGWGAHGDVPRLFWSAGISQRF